MLTEAEKKWLEERENRICKFCIHCPGYIDTNPCLDWWVDICVMDTTLEEFLDAAEFEARVAAKLALTYDGPEPCERNEEVKHCPWAKRVVEGKMTCKFCRLKHARLAVEQKMEKEGK